MKTLIKMAMVAAGLVIGSSAMAADGSLGATSTGTLDVQLVVPSLVSISGITGIDLGTYSGTGDQTGNDDLCIFRNGAVNYSVKATTNKSAFVLSSGDGGTPAENIAFTAYWNDVSGTTGRAELTYNTALTTQTGANTTAVNCGGTMNANFSVVVPEANIQTMVPATYQAEVTLVIAPE
jgi:hypothetical protein